MRKLQLNLNFHCKIQKKKRKKERKKENKHKKALENFPILKKTSTYGLLSQVNSSYGKDSHFKPIRGHWNLGSK